MVEETHRNNYITGVMYLIEGTKWTKSFILPGLLDMPKFF